MKNNWAIIDANSTVFTGTEDEMKSIFDKIIEDDIKIGWVGDLLLIEIHNIYR